MRWRIVLEQDPETGEWAVWCPELPGCASAGETQEAALANIREAIELYLQPNPIELSENALLQEVVAISNSSAKSVNGAISSLRDRR